MLLILKYFAGYFFPGECLRNALSVGRYALRVNHHLLNLIPNV